MKEIPNVTFLRYFLSAGQSKSISKAAQENFVTQSAISQAIGKLEIALGKQLITHEKNRFQMTSEGVLLLEKCKEIFTLFSEIEDAFNETDNTFKGKLSFACTHSFALSLLPPHLGKLGHLWPSVEPILRLGHTGMIVELVRKGEVDFGIVLENDDFSQFQSAEIHSGQYHLYHATVPQEHSLQRLILSEQRREIALLKKHLQQYKIDIAASIEVSSWEVIASLAEHGLGLGFLPDYVAKKRALIPYECKLPAIPYRILAIFPKNKKLSRNAQMVINLMQSPPHADTL